MKKIALMALFLSIFTLQGTVTANAFPSARLAAINRIVANNSKYLPTTNTTNTSTRQGKVYGTSIAVNSSLNFYDANGHSSKNTIATIYPGKVVTVLDGAKKYFSTDGNMYMYRIKFTANDGTIKTGYSPAGYIQLI